MGSERTRGRERSASEAREVQQGRAKRRGRTPREERRPQLQDEPTPPFPPQHQPKPGFVEGLEPRPRFAAERYHDAAKLDGKVALITGGDSGIGRAVAVIYAREGADVAINYLEEEAADAAVTREAVEREGRRCLELPGDLTDPEVCRRLVEETREELGALDILVHDAAHQNRKHDLEELSDEELERTFATNVFAYVRLVRAALPHLHAGAAIIATSSEAALEGNRALPDYSASKGAIDSLTKTLAQQLLDRGIRVNAVAPGPVWTPLNPADEGTSPEEIAHQGESWPAGRPAQPEEVAPAYVFLASDADSSYISGVVLRLLGGKTSAG